MTGKESKPENPCTVCMKHSGMEKTDEYQEARLKSLDRKFFVIMTLLVSNLGLLVIGLLLKKF